MNKNQTYNWLINDMKDKIRVSKRIEEFAKPLRGIYGIFLIKDNIESCVYVGKASNIYDRIFSSDSHLTKIRNGKHHISELNEAVLNNHIIDIRLLEEVPYHICDNYSKDIQLLSQKENDYISKFQNEDQCLNQLPEGRHISESAWIELKKH